MEVGFENKLKRSLELANKLAARFCLLVGDNELSTGLYILKEMATGEQSALPPSRLLENLLNRRN